MNHAGAALVLVVLASTGAAQQPQRPDAAEAKNGEIIYVRYCAACHGKSGGGDGPVAADLAKKPADLTALASKNAGKFPFDKVAGAIDGRNTPRSHGLPDMPVWGEVFAKTAGTDSPTVAAAVRRITHYVWSIQK
jgi:mono/diheme cytochrome c family protein